MNSNIPTNQQMSSIQQPFYYQYPQPNTYFYNTQYPPIYQYPSYQFLQQFNPYQQLPYYPPIQLDQHQQMVFQQQH